MSSTTHNNKSDTTPQLNSLPVATWCQEWKLGAKLELLALKSGGCGGHNNDWVHNESDWMIDGGDEDSSEEKSSDSV